MLFCSQCFNWCLSCSDRSSTRLHAPPGGKTSICLGNSQPEDVVKPLRRGSASAASSNNNIFGNQQESEEELEKKRVAARRPSNSLGMSGVMHHDENEAPTTARRVRQAPGGTSTFTLG